MKRLAFLLSALYACLPLSAQSISESDALSMAKTFINDMNASQVKSHGAIGSRQSSRLTLVKQGLTPTSQATAYYLFANEGGLGFIIVAGDERASHRILGYSTTGSINADNLPVNMQSWLESYAEQVECMTKRTTTGVDGLGEVEPVGNVVVAPLIQTQWNQDDPYNSKCPKSGSERSLVGCVGVALAQIMNYHRWPQQGNGQIEYEWNSSWIEKDFSQCTYDYDNLDVPQFLCDVAMGCKMNFGAESSSSNDVSAGRALINYFGYDKGVQWHTRYTTTISYSRSQGWSITMPGWSDEEWDGMIRTELNEGRPVYYTGQNRSIGGHAFVCDGYDDAGYFHFNWGWGGYCDGWFVTSALNPEYYNTGYNLGTSMLTGIQPDKGNELWLGTYGGASYAWGFCDSLHVMYCMENDSTHEKFYGTRKKVAMEKGSVQYAKDLDWVPEDFPQKADIPDGTYRKYLAYNIPGTDIYRPVTYGYGTDRNEAFETFKWVDIEKGTWNESGSRTFYATIDGNDYTFFILNDSEMRIKSLDIKQNDQTITIPKTASYRGKIYTTTEVNVHGVKSGITFPETVTEINMSYECSIPVALPESLEVLSLSGYQPTELTLPASLERIEYLQAPNITSLTIPANVSYIPDYTNNDSQRFECYNLKSLIFSHGSKMDNIPDYCFSSMTRLKELVLPDQIKTIGNYAFNNCGSLTKLELPNSLKEIGEYGFCNCTNLSEVVLNDDAELEIINQYAFNGCSNLETFNFVASIKQMPYAFRNSGMVKADLSKTQIEDYNDPFSECSGLECIIFPPTLKQITYLTTQNIQTWNIPNSVTYINTISCDGLPSLTIPKSVTYFYDLDATSPLTVICESPTPAEGMSLMFYKRGTNCKEAYIPAGSMQAYVNYRYSKTYSSYKINIPISELLSGTGNLDVIEDADGSVVMGGSEASGALVIPTTVSTSSGDAEVRRIQAGAFMCNTAITSVELPNTLGNSSASVKALDGDGSDDAAIGERAFAYCSNLSKVTVHIDEPLTINANVFEGLDLKEMTLRVPDDAVTSYKTADVWREFGTIEGFNPSGIEQPTADNRQSTIDDTIYDLQGRKVIPTHRGIYIQNGKKILK